MDLLASHRHGFRACTQSMSYFAYSTHSIPSSMHGCIPAIVVRIRQCNTYAGMWKFVYHMQAAK
jgi:hypothetical protein